MRLYTTHFETPSSVLLGFFVDTDVFTEEHVSNTNFKTLISNNNLRAPLRGVIW